MVIRNNHRWTAHVPTDVLILCALVILVFQREALVFSPSLTFRKKVGKPPEYLSFLCFILHIDLPHTLFHTVSCSRENTMGMNIKVSAFQTICFMGFLCSVASSDNF